MPVLRRSSDDLRFPSAMRERIGALEAEVERLRRELVAIRFDAECAAEGYAEIDGRVADIFAGLAKRARSAVNGNAS